MKNLIIVVLVGVLAFIGGVASVLYCPYVQYVVNYNQVSNKREKECTCEENCTCCPACPGHKMDKVK